MAEYAREEINAIGGFYAYGKDMINGSSVYDFDVTKLSVYTRDIGLAGIEVYDLLRDEYDIRLNWETLPIFWHIFPLVTGFRILNVW